MHKVAKNENKIEMLDKARLLDYLSAIEKLWQQQRKRSGGQDRFAEGNIGAINMIRNELQRFEYKQSAT